MSQHQYIVVATDTAGVTSVHTNKGWLPLQPRDTASETYAVSVYDSASACALRDKARELQINKGCKFQVLRLSAFELKAG